MQSNDSRALGYTTCGQVVGGVGVPVAGGPDGPAGTGVLGPTGGPRDRPLCPVPFTTCEQPPSNAAHATTAATTRTRIIASAAPPGPTRRIRPRGGRPPRRP